MNTEKVMQDLQAGNLRSLARCISIVENDLPGSEELLRALRPSKVPVIGITGPPGAGKSSLVNELLIRLSASGKKIGVIAVDPTSPFHRGSLLGDRIRMSEHFNNPSVFIRSLATRGSLGGLSSRILEISDVMRAAAFDLLIIETVGVGQSEVEIAGLADVTILVLVPEAGDEIQQIKSGIMEIGDLFVVNKADRPGADRFVKSLFDSMRDDPHQKRDIIKTVATTGEGVDVLLEKVMNIKAGNDEPKHLWLLTEKAWHLIQNRKMQGISKTLIEADIKEKKSLNMTFNLYQYIEKWL
jgi:LAO/AO transport system kinase